MLTKEEALKKAKEMSCGWRDGEVELVPLKDVNRLIREIYSVKPYTFEELHDDMWVWDDKKKEIIYLFKKLHWEPCKGMRYSYKKIDHSAYGYFMEFEENRFFPVTKAMEVQE